MPMVYCRRCYGLASDGERCPRCGSPDPSGSGTRMWGRLILGMLLAVAVTYSYFAILDTKWEKWERKFDRLPTDHLLYRSADEVANVIGLLVFLISWIVWVLVLRPRRRAHGGPRHSVRRAH